MKISLGVLSAAQDVRQQDAVVVAVRLVAEHDDVELLRPAAREHLLDGARAGHAVPDDDELLLHPSASLPRDVRCRAQISRRPMSSTRWPVAPGGRGQQHLQLGFGEEVLDDGERHMLVALGADREVAHRLAVAHQREVDELAAGIAGAQIDQLRPLVGGHAVGELVVERHRLVVAAALERIDAVEKTRCCFHGLFYPQCRRSPRSSPRAPWTRWRCFGTDREPPPPIQQARGLPDGRRETQRCILQRHDAELGARLHAH